MRVALGIESKAVYEAEALRVTSVGIPPLQGVGLFFHVERGLIDPTLRLRDVTPRAEWLHGLFCCPTPSFPPIVCGRH